VAAMIRIARRGGQD